MRLKSVKLTNFRGYRATTVIPIDEAMTGIIGRNDDGQSTIPEFRAVFFGSGVAMAYKSDRKRFSLSGVGLV
uniref:AAA family ATPase n=1 Tax=Roseivirga sp. TaxID=1964215 RepID=UPI004047F1F1